MKEHSILEKLYEETDVYIFGACERGQFVKFGLKEKGVRTLAFLDNDLGKIGTFAFDEVICIGLENANRDITIVVAVSEKYHAELQVQLKKDHFEKVYYLTNELYEMLYRNISDESIIRCRWKQRKKDIPFNIYAPQSFNEKIQWMKLNDRRDEYVVLSDKQAVKEWLKEKSINRLNIIPSLGVWSHFDEIKFDSLPEQFVLKATHDSGSIVLCKDKENFDISAARIKFDKILNTNYYWYDREWGYKGIVPRIIAEPYMTDESGIELKDYKFQCMAGRVELIQVDFGRFCEHKRNLYDRDWNFIEAEIKYPSDKTQQIARPENLDIMIKIVEELSRPFPYVRIDLYNINNSVYFGEFTFYLGGGYEEFRPYALDMELGSKIKLRGN